MSMDPKLVTDFRCFNYKGGNKKIQVSECPNFSVDSDEA